MSPKCNDRSRQQYPKPNWKCLVDSRTQAAGRHFAPQFICQGSLFFAPVLGNKETPEFRREIRAVFPPLGQRKRRSRRRIRNRRRIQGKPMLVLASVAAFTLYQSFDPGMGAAVAHAICPVSAALA